MPERLPTVYLDEDEMRRQVAAGDHRQAVGGAAFWEILGRKQFSLLVENGLTPEDRVIDIGCGAFRAGVHLVPFLARGHYYGIDASKVLIEAGYSREIIPAGLSDRLPQANLAVTADFDLSGFGTTFTIGLAQSVFSHLPIEHLDRCLSAVEPWFAPGARLFATIFPAPEDAGDRWIEQPPAGVVTKPDRDPYHYRPSQLAAVMDRHCNQWRMDMVGDWGHPRGQHLVVFTRRGGSDDE